MRDDGPTVFLRLRGSGSGACASAQSEHERVEQANDRDRDGSSRTDQRTSSFATAVSEYRTSLAPAMENWTKALWRKKDRSGVETVSRSSSAHAAKSLAATLPAAAYSTPRRSQPVKA